jgi:hypothetical protein
VSRRLRIEFHNGQVIDTTPRNYTIKRLANLDAALICISDVGQAPIPPSIRVRRSINNYPEEYSRAYALGCARSECWHHPLEVNVTDLSKRFIQFSSPLLLPGLSGGILVDSHGYIISMITSSGAGVGRSIPLYYISVYKLPASTVFNNMIEITPETVKQSIELSVPSLFSYTTDIPFVSGIEYTNTLLRLSPDQGFLFYARASFGFEAYESGILYKPQLTDTVSNVVTSYIAPKITILMPAFSIADRIGLIGIFLQPRLEVQSFHIPTKYLSIKNPSTGEDVELETSVTRQNFDLRTVVGLIIKYPIIHDLSLDVSVKMFQGIDQNFNIHGANYSVRTVNFAKLTFGLSF